MVWSNVFSCGSDQDRPTVIILLEITRAVGVGYHRLRFIQVLTTAFMVGRKFSLDSQARVVDDLAKNRSFLAFLPGNFSKSEPDHVSPSCL